MSNIDQRTYEIARDWLQSLGMLTAGSMPAEEAQIRCGAYASMLAEEYPAGAFTAQSLRAVGRECKFFPAYGEVCERLSAWCAENRAHRPALAGPVAEGALTAEDERWLAFWDRNLAEGFANVRCGKYPGVPDTPASHQRAHVASMVRRHAPAAWAQISGG